MLYFVPSWQDARPQSEYDRPWYVTPSRFEADATIKYVQMLFQDGSHPVALLSATYQPRFRSMLHSQGIYGVPYWSCFDAIQNAMEKSQVPFSFRDLNWSDNIEFVYTNFSVLGMVDDQIKACIEFDDDGRLLYVDRFEDGALFARQFYDDRGFLSSVVHYQQENVVDQVFYDVEGIWKLRLSLKSGAVEINPESPVYTIECSSAVCQESFLRDTYASMDDLLLEVMESFARRSEENDMFVISPSCRNNRFMGTALRDKAVAIALSQQFLSASSDSFLTDSIDLARCVISDTKETAHSVQLISKADVRVISPYCSESDYPTRAGAMQNNILIPVDALDNDLPQVVQLVAQYIGSMRQGYAHLLTRTSGSNHRLQLLARVNKILVDAGMADIASHFMVDQCDCEESLMDCMSRQRVVVDMATCQDIHVHALALANGIPCVVHQETPFALDGKNATVADSHEQAVECLHYYLDSLSHWNQAAIKSREVAKMFSKEALLRQWDEVIKSLG